MGLPVAVMDGRGGPARRGQRPFVAREIERLEFLLGAMDEHAKVIARDAQPLADAIAILFLEEERRQQLAVARLEVVDHAADGKLALLDEELRFGVGRARIGRAFAIVAWLGA